MTETKIDHDTTIIGDPPKEVTHNVISYFKGYKRTYGDNHWFWAVWINVIDHKELGQQEPISSGFVASRTGASRAAWDVLKDRIADRTLQRAYRTNWARQLLDQRRNQDNRPHFSRCSFGKHKWQWVVGYFDNILASGIAESPEAAHRAAELEIGSVCQVTNSMAEAFRTKQHAIERSKKTTDCDSTSRIEFIYECHRYYSDYDNDAHDSITRHRIVKRTQARLYVDRDPYHEHPRQSGDWTDYVQRTFVLDRKEFESTGRARRRSRGWWDNNTYYASPDIYFAEYRHSSRPECFVTLGVPPDADEADIKRAFKRLALTAHPDAGGTNEGFRELHLAYEQAMLLASRPA